ncbi:MAG TPA: protein-glutamate O-methyltransferase CheR [Deltaproteobacteria bacterium]|nr:protein-glutamate O-methyltransferase CheR [Deltaproteobacteria bacterium]
MIDRTASPIKKPRLSPETFRQLRDLINSKCGIFFGDNKRYLLESRLSRRLEERGLKSFEEYFYFLNYDKHKDRELSILLNSIVTNETSFFRDPAQLEAFAKGVVPLALEKKKNGFDRTLRVWSAASSTGEEPYTLAMMLIEAGLQRRGWRIEVTGSDISDNVLESAKRGIYEKYSLRNTPENYLRKYFTNSGDHYTVKPDVRQVVRYRKINLMDSAAMRTLRMIDIVFCRNVLIYFDDASKKQVISNLYDSLVSGGYLFLGFSESLHGLTRLFKPVSFDRSVVYQKV